MDWLINGWIGWMYGQTDLTVKSYEQDANRDGVWGSNLICFMDCEWPDITSKGSDNWRMSHNLFYQLR